MTSKSSELHNAYIGVGSNMGRRMEYLHFAVEALRGLGSCRCSSVYETAPVDYLEQPMFLNMVVHIQTALSASELLQSLQNIEFQADRKRDIRFGPRTLDLDVLLYDQSYICFTGLQIPHPRMWSRAFVLVPLADLAGDAKGLGGKTIGTLAEALRQKGEVNYVGRFW